MDTKTSLTDPLYVTWLHAEPEDARPRFGSGTGVRAIRGRVGITFAPGKRSDGLFVRARWERDLALDLDALVAQHVGLLVSLLEDPELTLLGIPDLIPRASERMRVLRLPIPDGGLPPDGAAVRAVVSEVVRRAEAGTNVVIHCRGGLGRAGTIGGCVLRALGLSADETFARLRRRHAESCPETDAQRAYVRAFAPELLAGDAVSSDDAARDASSHHATSMPSTPPRPDVLPVVTPEFGSRHDRVAGAVLAAAIGDALGHPTEFLTMEAIHTRFGPEGVRGFELFLDEGGRRVAPFTDDTQMAELVIEALLEERESASRGRPHEHVDAHDPTPPGSRWTDEARILDREHTTWDLDRTMVDLARRFVAWSHAPRGGHRAPGNACLSGCRALERGVPWREAGGPTAGGCGSVMRAWPFGLVFDDLSEAERWAVEHSKLTHRDPIALAACAAVVWGVGLGLRGCDVDETARAMIDAAARWSEPTAAMMTRAHEEARDGTPPSVTLDRLRGWAAHEAIAGALYVLVRHPDEPRAALLEGANTPGDSDSLASIAGALVGARVGLAELPPEWVRDVERSADLLTYAARLARLG